MWYLLSKTAESVGDREQEWIELAQRLPAEGQGMVSRVILDIRKRLTDTSEYADGEDELQTLIKSASDGISQFRSVLDAIEEGINEAGHESDQGEE